MGSKALIKVYIAYNNICMHTAHYIAAVLQGNRNLQVLDLGYNSFHAEGIEIIADALRNLSSLTALNINNNYFIDKFATSCIKDAILSNVNLRILDVSGNRLESCDIIMIAEGLQGLSSLTQLYLHNSNIKDDAADAIAAALLSIRNVKPWFEFFWYEWYN